MITVGCLVDSHPEKVSKIWDGPTVKTKSEKTLSYSDIEKLFPEFNTPLDAIPAQSMFRRKEDYKSIISKKIYKYCRGMCLCLFFLYSQAWSWSKKKS